MVLEHHTCMHACIPLYMKHYNYLMYKLCNSFSELCMHMHLHVFIFMSHICKEAVGYIWHARRTVRQEIFGQPGLNILIFQNIWSYPKTYGRSFHAEALHKQVYITVQDRNSGHVELALHAWHAVTRLKLLQFVLLLWHTCALDRLSLC